MSNENQSFTAQTADGRSITVDAPDEETAKRVAHEQAGGVGILSVEKTNAKKQKADDKAADKAAESEEAGNGGGSFTKKAGE